MCLRFRHSRSCCKLGMGGVSLQFVVAWVIDYMARRMNRWLNILFRGYGGFELLQAQLIPCPRSWYVVELDDRKLTILLCDWKPSTTLYRSFASSSHPLLAPTEDAGINKQSIISIIDFSNWIRKRQKEKCDTRGKSKRRLG